MHHEGAAGASSVGDDDDAAAGPHSVRVSTDCTKLCNDCDLANQLRLASCEDFCGSVDQQAVNAGCGTLLDDLLRCRRGAHNACSFNACPTQTNAFGVCVIDYCDSFPSTLPLCAAW